MINGFAAAIKRACNGVSCGLSGENVNVKLLLYADDIVILSDSPADLQRALDAAHAWALFWRFHFVVGPKKSAVMILGRGRGRNRAPAFSSGGQVLPRVKTYMMGMARAWLLRPYAMGCKRGTGCHCEYSRKLST